MLPLLRCSAACAIHPAGAQPHPVLWRCGQRHPVRKEPIFIHLMPAHHQHAWCMCHTSTQPPMSASCAVGRRSDTLIQRSMLASLRFPHFVRAVRACVLPGYAPPVTAAKAHPVVSAFTVVRLIGGMLDRANGAYARHGRSKNYMRIFLHPFQRAPFRPPIAGRARHTATTDIPISAMEPGAGIEPVSSVWKTDALPLS